MGKIKSDKMNINDYDSFILNYKPTGGFPKVIKKVNSKKVIDKTIELKSMFTPVSNIIMK